MLDDEFVRNYIECVREERMKEYRINLLPESYRRERRIDKWLIGASVVIVLEVMIFMALVVWPSKVELRRSIEKLDSVSKGWEDDSLIEVTQILNNLENVQQEVDEWTEKYEKVQSRQWISKSLLESLIERIPLGVGVNKLTFPSGQIENEINRSVRIEGNAEYMTAILNYITILEQVFGAEAVSFEAQNNEEIGLYDYSIDIEFATDEKVDREHVVEEENVEQ